MTQRIYKIQDVTFSTNLGQIKSWQPIIAGLAGLKSWVSGGRSFVTTSANKVVTLNDKAGGNGFTQSNAAMRGSVVESVANNNDAVKLTSDSNMAYDGLMTTGSNAKFSKVIVMRSNSATTGNSYILANNPAGDYLYLKPSTKVIAHRVGGSENTVLTKISNGFTLIVADLDIPNNNISIISTYDEAVVSKPLIAGTAISSGELYLNSGSASAFAGSDVDYAEIMIFDRPIIGTTSYDKVREYVKAKYNI